jgi:hypothetical protein
VYAGDTSWGLHVSPKLQRVGHAATPEPRQIQVQARIVIDTLTDI